MGILGKSRPAKKASPLKKVKLTWTRARATDKKAVEDAAKYIKKAVGELHELPRTYHGKPLSEADKGALGMVGTRIPGRIIKGNPKIMARSRWLKSQSKKKK